MFTDVVRPKILDSKGILPAVGDPLTVVAGMLREPLPTFILLVAVGKMLR